MRIADASVLVTGSSRGIGAAIARRLVRGGAEVILHGRDTARLDALARELGMTAVALDLTEEASPELLAEKVGRVHAVVHCAGAGRWGDLRTIPAADVDRLVQLNLVAPMRLTRALLPGMLEGDAGHIAFVGSIAGLTGVPHECVYSAAKSGLLTFAQSLRLELADTRIGVSTVSPAAVRTDFWVTRGASYQRRLPRLVEPDRVARLVVRDIEHDRPARIVPRWIGIAPMVRSIAPNAYQRLAARFG